MKNNRLRKLVRSLGKEIGKVVSKSLVKALEREAKRKCPYCREKLGLEAVYFGEVLQIRKGVLAHRACFEESDRADEVFDLGSVVHNIPLHVDDGEEEGGNVVPFRRKVG